MFCCVANNLARKSRRDFRAIVLYVAKSDVRTRFAVALLICNILVLNNRRITIQLCVLDRFVCFLMLKTILDPNLYINSHQLITLCLWDGLVSIVIRLTQNDILQGAFIRNWERIPDSQHTLKQLTHSWSKSEYIIWSIDRIYHCVLSHQGTNQC